MSSFEQQVKQHIWLSAAPDYTAKGDAANFFRINRQRALPVLEKLANDGDKGAAYILESLRRRNNDDDKPSSAMSRRPDLF